jgi:hypothetical protein
MGSQLLATDENKRERHMRLLTERLIKIDSDFNEGKESLYQSKTECLKRELREILNGTHSEFVRKLEDLEEDRKESINRAESWRKYQLELASSLYKMEQVQAEQEYLAEKEGLKDRMLAAIEEKRKKLKEDMDILVIDAASSIVNSNTDMETSRFQTRKLRRRDKEEFRSSKKRQQSAGPPILLTLKEAEITDDINLISKLTSKKAAYGKRGVKPVNK